MRPGSQEIGGRRQEPGIRRQETGGRRQAGSALRWMGRGAGLVLLIGLFAASAGQAGQMAPAPGPTGPGAPLDPSGFRYQRAIAPGDPGLVTLPLDAATLAHSQGPSRSFADVRVVDANNAQVPYVLERREDRLSVDLELRSVTPQTRDLKDRPGHRSFYAITLPVENLPDPVIALQTSATVFRRFVQIGVEQPPDRRRREAAFEQVTQAVWEHADAAAPPPLELGLRFERSRELLLIVDEGDNKPLPITAVKLLLPGWRLRFHRPAGALTLLYGKDDIGRPRYDVAVGAPPLMTGEAREVAAEPERAPEPPATIMSPRAFWVGLGVAVVLLLGLLVRLITSGTAPPPSPPGP